MEAATDALLPVPFEMRRSTTTDRNGLPGDPDEPARSPEDPGREDLETSVRRHAHGVWRYLRILGCSRDEADELTQESFVVAIDRGWGDRDSGQVGAFLRVVARHLFLRRRRDERRRAVLFAQAADWLWQQNCAADGGAARIAALRECVAALSDRSRRVLNLVYRDDRSRADVAAAVGLRENGVKTLLQRIRRTLRDCVTRKQT